MIHNKHLKQQKLTKPQKRHSQPTEQTFLEHIYELRKRLFWIAIAVVGASALGFQYKDHLISAVMAPLHGEKLVYLTPAGGFSFIFTLSLYFGLLLAIPVIIYHIYRFIEPMLGYTSRKLIAGFILLSVLLAALGAFFGYYVTIPAALNFLANFAGESVTPNLTAESYLNFVVTYVLGLAVLFQIPLLLFLFDHVKSIPPGALGKSQRFVIIAATVIAAIITPTPDAVNMMIVAVPLILMYEVGVLAVFIRHRASSRRARRATAPSQAKAAAIEPVPAAHAPVMAVEPKRVHIPVATTQYPIKKSVDGFMRVRQPQAGVAVPAARTSPLMNDRQVYTRPSRSIDGFFKLEPAAN